MCEVSGTYEVLMTLAIEAWPEAVMIRDFRTSAGEQTAASLTLIPSRTHCGHILVAIVPYYISSFQRRERKKDIQPPEKRQSEELVHLPSICSQSSHS